MAILSLSRLPKAKQNFLAIIAVGFLAFVVYIHWFAAREQLLFISSIQLDKVAHFFGGVFAALVFEWRFRRPAVWQLAVLLLGVTVGWEIIEFFVDSETALFYRLSPDLWVLDSLGDITAAVLGAYGYWTFAMKRNQNLPG